MPSELTRYYKHRVVYVMEDYVEADFDDKVLLCVPKFAWLQARNLLRSYGVRRNAYGVLFEEAGYYTPDDALFDKIDESISQFLAGDDMTCDITGAIEALTALIQSMSGCDDSCGNSGSFGAGTVDPVEGVFVDDGTNWPSGFADRAEYDTYKCQVANAIIGQINADLGWLSTASIATLTASALAISLLTPVPFDDILVLLGALVAFAAQGLLVGFAGEITTAIAADPSGYVCALFAATSSGDAKTSLGAKLAADVSAGAQALGGYFIKNVSMNALFEDDANYSQVATTMSVDCSGCVCPSFGSQWTIIERGFNYAIIESIFGSGSEFLYFSAHTLDADAVTGGGGPFGPYCGPEAEYTVTVLSGVVSDYGTRDSAGVNIVPAWTAWPGSYTGTARHFFSRQATSTSRYQLRIDYT